MPIIVEAVDTRTAPESQFRELHRLHLQYERDEKPDDPPFPWERRLVAWRAPLPDMVVPRWLAYEDGTAIGTAGYRAHEWQNLENAECWVWVDPEYRGRGAARALWTPLFDSLQGDGRIRIDTFVLMDRPEEALLERAGLARVYVERLSRLDIAGTDRPRLESWVERAPERASGYSLLRLTPPIDDGLLDKWCDATNLMHTAPKDDAVEEDVFTTPGAWRGLEERFEARGIAVHILVAVQDATGDWVGYTALAHDEAMPVILEQWDTAVDPGHRNRGIGRWLKAALFLDVAGRYPDARWIDTWNAESNDAMLGINVAMGFRPYWTGSSWQGMTAEIRGALGA